MTDPEHFDAFYSEARGRLLLQTYALTGDVTAARAAVRAAFVMAWHHWRKIGRADDAEALVRPYAWRHALRGHRARLWQRDKRIDDEARDVLDALAALPLTQRKALILTQLAGVAVPQMAREVGLAHEKAARELSIGAKTYALRLNVAPAELRETFSPLVPIAGAARLPRATIVRRAGTARRRTHTAIGAAGAAAALALCTALVADPSGARPSLDRAASDPSESWLESDDVLSLTPAALLTPDAVSRGTGSRGWRITNRFQTVEGTATPAPCQQEVSADPASGAGFARAFERQVRRGAKPTALQLVELSRTERAARRGFTTAVNWYAGCDEPRAQLLSTWRATDIGDQAMLVVLRDWNAPVRTVVVGVARTGRFITTTVVRTPGAARPAVGKHAAMLAGAVQGMCTLPEGGDCTSNPQLRAIAPLPVGEVPALINALDLPPVRGVAAPWSADRPRRATTNPAATRCDSTSFNGRYRGARFNANYTQTHLILGEKLPAEFGITETVAALPVKQANQLVDEVRADVGRCDEGDRGLGTEVRQLTHHNRGQQELTAWEITIEISDNRTVRYDMAVMRRGTSVAQLGFVPAGGDMVDGAFVDLAYRALERLIEMPEPAEGTD